MQNLDVWGSPARRSRHRTAGASSLPQLLRVPGMLLNLHGLRDRPSRRARPIVETELTLDRQFEGWEGIVHGGIMSTILGKESWPGRSSAGTSLGYARMSVEFRRPVEVGTPIRADGWITRRDWRRIAETAGRIVDSSTGEELATATGLYVAADAERKRFLQERYAFRRVGAARLGDDRAEPRESPSARRRVRRSPSRCRGGAGCLARRLHQRTRRVRGRPDARSRRAGRRSGLPRRPAARRAGDRRCAASAGRSSPPSSPPAGSDRRPEATLPAALLLIADRLFRERELKPLVRVRPPRADAAGRHRADLAALRRGPAAEAGDWITVDTLAHPYGKGIAAEPFRWAELEQLVYNPSRWERRLIGSASATMTTSTGGQGRDPRVAVGALPLLAQLMGDAEPDVEGPVVGVSLPHG